MRVCYFLLAVTAASLLNSAIVSATPEDSKLISTASSPKRSLRSQNFLEWPEELEEFVHHHHHIREIFTRWCLEDHEETVNKLEDTREDRNPRLEAIYKKQMRVLYAFLIITTLFTTSGAAPAVKNSEVVKGSSMNKDGRRLLRSANTADEDGDSNHEEREGLFSLPEELEELVETHHHIREMFTKWCLEKESPEEMAEDAKPGTKEAAKAELYKKFIEYQSRKSETEGKHKMLECNV